MTAKKVLSEILACVMLLSFMTGCKKDDDVRRLLIEIRRDEPNEFQPSEDEWDIYPIMDSDYTGDAKGHEKVTKEVFEPTLLAWGYNYDTMNMFKEAFKYTNVMPKAFIADTADAPQAFDLMLATGDMPDIARDTIDRINSAGEEGAFYPLDTLIDRFAPNIKAYFEEHPEIKAACVASDGKLYAIPSTYESVVSEGFFIRKDWLNKLGLKVPTTVEEYHDALLAFKNQDPNGNGKADEIPFFQKSKTYMSLAQLWGAYNRDYVDESGKVRNGRLEPEFKVAMQNIIKWKNEGLIDPEISTRSKPREVLLGSNVGGSTHDWFSSTSSFTQVIREVYKGEAWAQQFEFVPMDPPADINGEVKEIYSRSPVKLNEGWGITRNNQYVVETIRYMDWWFTEQGKLTYWYGEEGVDYKMVDGVPTLTDYTLNDESGVPAHMIAAGQNIASAPMSMEAEMKTMNQAAREGFSMYHYNVDIKPQFPMLAFTPEENEEVAEIQWELNTYIDETIDKWYSGDQPLNDSTWNTYIEEAKALGSERLLELQQAAYDRYVANGGF